MHVIERVPGGLRLERSAKIFVNLTELVDYYAHHIDVELPCLLIFE